MQLEGQKLIELGLDIPNLMAVSFNVSFTKSFKYKACLQGILIFYVLIWKKSTRRRVLEEMQMQKSTSVASARTDESDL